MVALLLQYSSAWLCSQFGEKKKVGLSQILVGALKPEKVSYPSELGSKAAMTAAENNNHKLTQDVISFITF